MILKYEQIMNTVLSLIISYYFSKIFKRNKKFFNLKKVNLKVKLKVKLKFNAFKIN